jgi:hypothetical protein
VALSTTKGKYIACSIVSREATWLHNFHTGLHSRHDVEGSFEALVHIHK